MAGVTWVIDSSSLVDIKSQTSLEVRARLYARLTSLAVDGKIHVPREVVHEMKRGAQPRHRDEALEWVVAYEPHICVIEPTVEELLAIMKEVGDVVDHEKDSGVDDADPYVLALAVKLQAGGLRVRIVTEDRKDRLRKVSMTTAAGILGVPCVPLVGFLRAEGIG